MVANPKTVLANPKTVLAKTETVLANPKTAFAIPHRGVAKAVLVLGKPAMGLAKPTRVPGSRKVRNPAPLRPLQINPERRALIHHAAHFDAAAVVLHDAVDEVEAHSRALDVRVEAAKQLE